MDFFKANLTEKLSSYLYADVSFSMSQNKICLPLKKYQDRIFSKSENVPRL